MKSLTNSDLNRVDLAIVGGGLAGCAMAWQANLRGLRVAIIDRCANDTSSRVAAGLVTPITGSRLALSWRYQEFFQEADTLYRLVQQAVDRSFWTVAPALRIFSGRGELELFEDRWARSEPATLPGLIHVERLSSQDLSDFEAPLGGFLMSPAGRLDTESYLRCTQVYFDQQGMFFDQWLDLDRELICSEDGFHFPSLGLQAKSVCLAQGVHARTNRWFNALPLHPARGDILRVAACGPKIERTVHLDGWIVPLATDEFLLGATYARHGQDSCVDSPIGISAREDLIQRWQGFFPTPAPDLRVLEHRAAIRPASYDRHPLIGVHAELPRLMCLNGLGSKGSLMAPRLATILLECLERSIPIEKALRFDRKQV